jgi:hypothetical protein
LLSVPFLTLLIFCSEAPEVEEQPKGRIVLAEFFTFARCTYCPWAEHALDSLSHEYDDSLALIAYHRRVLGDTLSPEYIAARESYYGITTSPATIFDGVSGIIQTQDPSQNYLTFKGWIIQRRNVAPKLELNLETTLLSSSVNLKLNIVSVDSIEEGNYCLFIVLYEDSVYFPQTGVPESIFHYVVRKIVPDENGIPLDLSYPDSLVQEVYFNLESNWNQEKLGVVAFIQDIETKKVLQALVDKRIGD